MLCIACDFYIFYANAYEFMCRNQQYIKFNSILNNSTKISYAGLSKWSQRGGLENRLPNRHGGSNPSACAIKMNTIPRGWCLFLYHSQRGRTLVRKAKRGVRIPQAQSIPRGRDSSRYLRREEMSDWILYWSGTFSTNLAPSSIPLFQACHTNWNLSSIIQT